jgi:hypothetical protein
MGQLSEMEVLPPAYVGQHTSQSLTRVKVHAGG